MERKLTRLAIPEGLAFEAWYRAHRAAGGAADAVQEELLAEVEAEDVSVLQANPGAGGVH